MRLCLWQLGVLLLFTRQVYSILCIEHTLHSGSPPSSTFVPCGSQQLSKRSITDPITFDFTCRSASQDQCAKVNDTLVKAGQILASVIQFNKPIHVNASYLPFCQDLNDCDTTDGALDVGQAYPAVSYLMVDTTDNMTRMYPQAILKQFDNLPANPQWSEYDIKAQFNSEIDWYFPSDDRAIDTNETDLLRTVVHELVHGLGFVNAWSDDMYNQFSVYIPSLKPFLVPMKLRPPNELAEVFAAAASEQGNQPLWGFVEFPLDKYLYTGNTSLTAITKLLNTWGNGNVMFQTILDMVNSWYCLDDIREKAEALYKDATTAQDIRALFPDGTSLLLETSLETFVDGTSISHVDRATYGKSEDFLMVYYTDSGVTLDTLVQKYSGGPIGTHLIHALASLGYALQPSLNLTIQPVRPKLSFWEASADLVGTESNPSPSVSINTDGPAQYPTATSTSSSSSCPSFFVNHLHYIVPLFILFSFTR